MVDIKAIQAAIDRLKVGHMTEASCEALVTRLERAIQDVPICTVPHNCDMLEEHITGGGEHSNIEERLCCLEAAAGLAQEKIKALEEKWNELECDHAFDEIKKRLRINDSKLLDDPIKDSMPDRLQWLRTNASEQKHCSNCGGDLGDIIHSTDVIPGEEYCNDQCLMEAVIAVIRSLKASEQKSEVITSTITIPDGIQITPTTMTYQGPKCDHCNAPLGFNAYSSGATPGKTFCGPECAWKAEIEQRLSSLEKHEKCLQCNGLGFVVVGQEISLTGTTVDIQTCQRCGGTGRL